MSMSLEVTTLAALKGRIYFTLSTAEGVTLSSSYVYLDMRYRTPKLSVSPQLLDVQIANGASPIFYDVTLQNVGSMASSTIEVKVPPGHQNISIAPTTEYISSLLVEKTIDVSFKVSLPGEVAVGTTYYGVIGQFCT